MRPFRRLERSRALSKGCDWSLATWQTMHGWRCEGKARSREDEMAVPSWVLTRHFAEDTIPHFGCLLSAFEHIFLTLPKELRWSHYQWRTSKAELRTSMVDLLCVTDGERRPLQALPGRVFLKGQLHMQPRHWVKKEQACWRPFERKSSSIKVKGRQSRSTARDFGSIVVGIKPRGRTVDSNKYI